MKNVLFALAAIFTMTFATVASAENFKNNTFSLTALSGALDFTLDGNEDGLTDATAGVGLFAYTVGDFDAAVKEIRDLLGRIHNQKIWYRPRNQTYISG